MNKFTFIILYIFFSSILNAQPYETNPDYKRANHWLFGDSVWLDFNYNPPQNRYGSKLNSLEPSTSYSNSEGELLFYSDGMTVWNRNHNIIKNGTNIDGHYSSSQGAVFVKMPDNDSIVYLFTTDFQCNSKGLRYSKIRINSYIDSSEIIEKNILLITNVTESIAVTHHQNRKDSWIVVHSSNGDDFHAFLLTNKGILDCPVSTSIGSSLAGNSFRCQTKSKFNHQGKEIAFIPSIDNNIQLFNFDNQSGVLSNYKLLDSINIPTGVAFSSNDSFMFFTERSRSVRRLNLFNFKEDTIYRILNNEIFIIGILKSQYDVLYLNVIDSNALGIVLNLEGDTPQFILKGHLLNDKKLNNGLPNYNQSYYFTPAIDFAYKLSCIDSSIQFYGQDTFGANIHNWSITKQGVSPITSNQKSPQIQFQDSGTYEIKYIASNGSRSDTLSKHITIYPKPEKDFLGTDLRWCENIDTNVILKAPAGMHCYQWSDGSNNNELNINSPGEYWVKITGQDFCAYYDTVNVVIDTLPNIEKNFLGEDINWCENIDTIFTLTAPTGMMNYIWSTSDTTHEIVTNTPGIYWAKIYTHNNCIMADTIILNRDTLPNIEKNFLGENVGWCENLDTVISIIAPVNMIHYNWNTGDTLQFIETDSVGIYWVKATALNNCIISDTIELTNYPAPEIPIIYKSNDTLITESNTDIYQWYFNEQEFGGNEPFIKLIDTGVYQLKVTNSFGCYNFSDTFQYYSNTIDIGYQIIKSNLYFNVFPNPFENKLLVNNNYNEEYDIKVYNINGQIVYEHNLIHGNNLIRTDKWETGIYLIRITSKNQQIKSYKLIKQNE